MATVFKDLLSILVDSKKKSTPRQARLAALFKFEPLVEASSPAHLMLQETPGALQFGSGGGAVIPRGNIKSAGQSPLSKETEISALGRNATPHHLQLVCHRATANPLLSVIPGLWKIETRASLPHQNPVTLFSNISVRGRKL
jgi:hypothetical protein